MEQRRNTFSGGREMYDRRKANNWEQGYIEKWTRERFGDEGVLTVPQVSKLENGSIKRISFEDAVHWGAVFGLEPNDMASIFGLWQQPVQEPTLDPTVREINERLEALPSDLKDVFLENLNHEIWLIGKMYEKYYGQAPKSKPKRHTEPPAVEAGSR